MGSRAVKHKRITDKMLNSFVSCAGCKVQVQYRFTWSRVDGNNGAITNNALPYCINCKDKHDW